LINHLNCVSVRAGRARKSPKAFKLRWSVHCTWWLMFSDDPLIVVSSFPSSHLFARPWSSSSREAPSFELKAWQVGNSTSSSLGLWPSPRDPSDDNLVIGRLCPPLGVISPMCLALYRVTPALITLLHSSLSPPAPM
jgi:hypothetical protein